MTVRQRYMPVDIVVPAGTNPATPQVTPLTLGDVNLNRVDIRIPPGPAGLVGVAIITNGVNLVPWSADPTWLIGTDERFSVTVNTEITQHVTINAYNVDIRTHHVYCRFLVTPMSLLQATTVPAAAPITFG